MLEQYTLWSFLQLVQWEGTGLTAASVLLVCRCHLIPQQLDLLGTVASDTRLPAALLE